MTWLLAFAIGMVAGLRSMVAPAVVSWAASLRWIGLEGTSLAWVGSTWTPYVVSLFAVGELVGDKLPFTPSRLSPGPLVARFVSGGLCGAALALASGASALPGAIVGAIGGIAGAYAGYHVRHYLVTTLRWRDIVVAVLEDLVAIGAALAIVSAI